MFTYIAYGLTIGSAISLPELVRGTASACDVTITFGKVVLPPDGDQDNTCLHDGTWCFHVLEDDIYFFLNGVSKFLLRGGREIIIDLAPGVDEQSVRLPLLGPLFAVLLSQRGLLVLHASAVAVRGTVVAFVGEKGMGKSTTAAALYSRGHTFVADDAVAVDLGHPPKVFPSFPQFKLLPDAVICSLGEDPEVLPRIAPIYEKRVRRITNRFSETLLPLGAIYVLADGAELKIRRLSPQSAIKDVIANSYIARFGRSLLNGTVAAAHLRQCADLTNQSPIFRLERPKASALLPHIAELVEAQLHSSSMSPDLLDFPESGEVLGSFVGADKLDLCCNGKA